MSDTPRTDAAAWHIGRDTSGIQVVKADFARMLERELSSMRAQGDPMRELTDHQLEKLHSQSSIHRSAVKALPHASCFYCIRDAIKVSGLKWTDCYLTAICQYCGTDAILPGELPVSVLAQMRAKYFDK